MPPSNRVTAGARNRRIVIQRPVTSQSSYGSTVTVWENFLTLWAELVWQGGDEQYQDPAIQRVSRQEAIFRIPFHRGIKTSMRVIHDQRPYAIDDVREIRLRRNLELRTHAIEVQSGPGGYTAHLFQPVNTDATGLTPTPENGSSGIGWDDPILTQHASVQPLVNASTGYPHNPNAMYVVPGTGTLYPTPTFDDAGAATQALSRTRYYALKMAALGRALRGHGLFLQHLGVSNHTTPLADNGISKSLFRNPLDQITSLAGTFPYAAVGHPFHALGRAACKAQALAQLGAYRDGLAVHGLPKPGLYPCDYEDGFHFDTATGSGSWHAASIVDARANSEIVLDGMTWNQLLASRTTVSGGAITIDAAQTIYATANLEYRKWLGWVYWRMRGAALREAIAGPVSETLGIPFGNYQDHHFSPTTPPVYDDLVTLPIERTVTPPLDHQHILLYPMSHNAFNGYGTAAAAITAWNDALGLSGTAGSQSLDLARICKANVLRRITMARKSPKPIFAWVPPIGPWSTTIHGVSYGFSHDDLEELSLATMDVGGSQFMLWWGLLGITNEARASWHNLLTAMDNHKSAVLGG